MKQLLTGLALASVTLCSSCTADHKNDSNNSGAKDQLPIATWYKPIKYQKPGTAPLSYSSELTSEAIIQVANQVADWQLAQYDIRSNQMRVEDRASALPQGWIYATLHIGLSAWALASENEIYNQTVRNISAVNDWQLGPRVYHADDHAIGQVYMDLYRQYKNPNMIRHLKETLDWVVANPSQRTLNFESTEHENIELAYRTYDDPWCTQRWCWADAIFMAPPVFAQLSELTGDNKYLEFMDKEFWLATDYLYRSEQQLYLRDSRYFERKDPQGQLIYWGRGNGWVLAGLARTLSYLPADFTPRSRYVELFTKMSNRLLALQNVDGSWPSSLLESNGSATPESSGTGLLVFGLAWGVNQGLLDKSTFVPAIEKGWQSLVNSVDESGRIGWVQQVAYAPGSATEHDTQLYGTGAFLLAASEVIKLGQNAN
ncbi:glycoside hydrolase family 88/105 protein [Rheinheimera maricola]|uniref:Glycoside hydrolase family 88 protein n=1 Tax=Rheinheimera maricola TaxID=2793282 RepID=A0ABS7XE50_9GAMM|nr:glycoside hydrolase family 88 protein [Rheinheimera maricola]MBZ9613849.1 glycoside hydrolase family 88 protein [Rheinheimera maricola]